jgi:hypothetical protein
MTAWRIVGALTISTSQMEETYANIIECLARTRLTNVAADKPFSDAASPQCL